MSGGGGNEASRLTPEVRPTVCPECRGAKRVYSPWSPWGVELDIVPGYDPRVPCPTCDGSGVIDTPEAWSCSHCGPHPDSTATWCAAGCGRDYNRMEPVVIDTPEEESTA